MEAYLKRRGWKESLATCAYMTALQSSVMSLYEVSDIVPGQSLRARELIRGGEPVLVTERSATQTLKLWDRIAARIVPQREASILAGGLLAFTLEGSQQLLAQLRERGSQGLGNRRGSETRDVGGVAWLGQRSSEGRPAVHHGLAVRRPAEGAADRAAHPVQQRRRRGGLPYRHLPAGAGRRANERALVWDVSMDDGAVVP